MTQQIFPTYEPTMKALCERDERVVVLTAENRAAIRGLPQILGQRFIDVGITEQTMIGVAAGLALRGRRPVAHALATFLTLRAFEFIRDDLGIPKLPAVLVGGVPGFLSDANGPTHQAIDDVSLMRGIPNMQVVCPADEAELAQALVQLVACDCPTYVRHIAMTPGFTHTHPFELGKAEVLMDGDDIGILTYGLLTRHAHAAAEKLVAAGKSVRLVHLATLKPLDEAAVLKTLEGCRVTFTIEDHFLTGGLFSIVAELMAKKGRSAKVVPFALEERWFVPTLLPHVLEREGFTADKLVQRITAALPS
jgi:transketolase